jgi:hypothetical protein
MGLAEVAKCDRTIDRRENFREADLGWLTCENIPTSDSALGADEARSFQCKQDLFEVGLRKSCALSNIANRSRTGLASSERE